jgi:hypothetical protein
MSAAKKPIKLIMLATLLLGGVYLYMNLGGLITRTAEKIASDALGVRVNIGNINVSLQDKKVTVNRLEISNPPGYRETNAMTAEKIIIALNTASKKLVDFKDVQVIGSVVNLEVNEKGMNLNDLKNLANRKKQKESVGSEQVRVIVQHMVVAASVINPSITLLNRDIQPLHMPAIKLSGIGQGGGVNADVAIVKVLTQYLNAVEREARESGMLNDMPGIGDVKRTLDDAAGGLKKLFQ